MANRIVVSADVDLKAYNAKLKAMQDSAKNLKLRSRHVIESKGGGIAGGGGGFLGGGAGEVFKGMIAFSAIKGVFDQIAGAIRGAASELLNMNKEAKNLGMTLPKYETIITTFERMGKGDKIRAMLPKLDAAREEAIEGNEKLIKSFGDLGVSVDDLAEKDDIFDQMISEYAKFGGAGKQREAAESIFGKRQMLGMDVALRRYGGGMREEHAFEPTQEDADRLEAANLMWTRISGSIGNLLKKVTAATVAPFAGTQDYVREQRQMREEEAASKEAARKQAIRQAAERKAALIKAKEDKIRGEYAEKFDEARKNARSPLMDVAGRGPMAGVFGGGNRWQEGGSYARARSGFESNRRIEELTVEMNKKLAAVVAATAETAENTKVEEE